MLFKKGDVVIRKPECYDRFWAKYCKQRNISETTAMFVEYNQKPGDMQIWMGDAWLVADKFYLFQPPSLNLEDYV